MNGYDPAAFERANSMRTLRTWRQAGEAALPALERLQEERRSWHLAETGQKFCVWGA